MKILIWVFPLLLFACASAPEKERYELYGNPVSEAEIIDLVLKNLDSDFFKSGDFPVFYADYWDKKYLYGEKLRLLDAFMTSNADGMRRTLPSGVAKNDTFDTYEFTMSIRNEEIESAWIVKCPQGRCLEYNKSTGYLVKGENGVVESLSGRSTYTFQITKEGPFKASDLKWVGAKLVGLRKDDPIAAVRQSPKDLRYVRKRLIYRGMPLEAAALSLKSSLKDFENVHNAGWFRNIQSRGQVIYDFETSIY